MKSVDGLSKASVTRAVREDDDEKEAEEEEKRRRRKRILQRMMMMRRTTRVRMMAMMMRLTAAEPMNRDLFVRIAVYAHDHVLLPEQ